MKAELPECSRENRGPWDGPPVRSGHLTLPPCSRSTVPRPAGAPGDDSMDRLRPKCLAAGFPNVSVTFENVTTVPPRTQTVNGDGFPNGRSAAVACDECRAGDHESIGHGRAEFRAAGRPVGGDDTVRHADVVRVSAAGGRVILVHRALRNPVVRVSMFMTAAKWPCPVVHPGPMTICHAFRTDRRRRLRPRACSR